MCTTINVATDIYICSLCDRATEPTGTTIEGWFARPSAPYGNQCQSEMMLLIYTHHIIVQYVHYTVTRNNDNVHNAVGSAIHIIVSNYCFDEK